MKRYEPWLGFMNDCVLGRQQIAPIGIFKSAMHKIMNRAKKKLDLGDSQFGEKMYEAKTDALKNEILDEFADVIGWLSPYHDMVDGSLPRGLTETDTGVTEDLLIALKGKAKNSLLSAIDAVTDAYLEVMEAISDCESYAEKAALLKG